MDTPPACCEIDLTASVKVTLNPVLLSLIFSTIESNDIPWGPEEIDNLILEQWVLFGGLL